METENITRRVHCVALAYPAQGHINPMLQFSKHLVQAGVRITLVTTRFYCKKLQKLPPSIALDSISDGFDNGGYDEAESGRVYFDVFWKVGPQTLAELLEKLGKSGDPVDCIIYDAFLPWPLDVAKKFGIIAAAFLTQNMAVNSIYHYHKLGNLQLPLKEHEIALPALPKLGHGDLPSFFFTYEEDSASLDLVVGQFSNIEKADWILCNTFYELEKEVIDWKMKIWPKFRTIGPAIPSMFLDKRLKDDETYGGELFKSEEESLKWLDNKPKGSVVYVSFGSIAVLSEEQIEEIAGALRDCGFYFLWVVRASEESKLPKGFTKKTEKGLVVTWCFQLKVLAHDALGCFITHCGWNSTLEALCLGVPMITMPWWSDQGTNAKLIVDVWKIGVRGQFDEKKIVRREALKHCLGEIMESERGKEIKSNAIQWKNLAVKSVKEGGSSHQNITEFVNSLFNL